MTARSFRSIGLATVLAAACAILPSLPASAETIDLGNLTYTTDVSTLPQYKDIQFLDLGPNAAGVNGKVSSAPLISGTGSNQATISFTGTQSGVYHGTSAVANAPIYSGGASDKNYLGIGTNSSATIRFAADQRYIGMLWGSVETYNVMTFYKGTEFVQVLTGSDIFGAATPAQGASGTYVVNVAMNEGYSFDRVVFTSSRPQFEIAQLQYSQTTAPFADGGPVTNPAPLPALAGTPFGLAAVAMFMRRRRKAALAA